MKRTVKILISLIFILSMLMPFSLSASADALGEEKQSFLFGDVDRDKNISSADARLSLRFAVSLDRYSRGHLLLGDTDNDGGFSSSDARSILRAAVGIESLRTSTVEITLSDFDVFPEENESDFEWVIPDAPVTEGKADTFTFTVYGYGHGVGLSQYGALSLDEMGYTYDRILNHYYTGVEIKYISEFPAVTLYPVGRYTEESPDELVYSKEEVPTAELLTRIVYQEIYGLTKKDMHSEALKAQAVAVFTNLVYYGFDVNSRWSVGIASPKTYEQMPDELKTAVNEVLGLYITKIGEEEPIQAVYSCMCAGMSADATDIWGGKYSYLKAVESPFDMQRKGFITTVEFTSEELRTRIENYAKNNGTEITLSDDPSQWIEILEHSGSIDADRGYVIKIRVGDRELTGYNQFLMKLLGNTLRSPCFTVTYTPPTAE